MEKAKQLNIVYNITETRNLFILQNKNVFLSAVTERAPRSYESQLSRSVRTVEAQVGDYVKLVCFVRSSLPVSFTWKQGSRTLDATSDVLVLPNAQVGQSGTYTCTMQNDLGADSLHYFVSIEGWTLFPILRKKYIL